ncbi:MAG: flagellar hook-associated protein FlgK [Thermoguttaceae bacterium]|jgi:flagellar hook-associated protein 1 FlgK
MSLLGSIQIAAGTLQATDIGLQVVGQNVANANTPGYIKETTNFTPGPTQQNGALLLGTGVQVLSITQQVDQFLEQRLRTASGDQANADTVQQVYSRLESAFGALGSDASSTSDTTNGGTLSTAMNQFFSAISNVLNQPQDVSVRNLAVTQGQALATTFNQMTGQVSQMRSDVNGQISDMAADINRLTSQVASLNRQITGLTGGGTALSDASGLADQRSQALTSLSQLLGVTTTTQADGSVSVNCGNESLVYEGSATAVSVAHSTDRGMTVSTIQVAGTDVPLNPASGQLRGLLTARDSVLGGFQEQLDTLAGTLASEFNKVYSSGQGLTGYTQLTAQNAVADPDQALDSAGLPTTPVNGSFQIMVQNTRTGATTTTDVPVNLLGTGHQTTLDDVAQALGGIQGLQAQVQGGKLTISATNSDTQFAFANDTSGLLAGLGLNTFFTGSTASDLAVNPDVVQDPGKFAASSDGIGADTTNATTLANFLDQPLASQNGNSVNTMYNLLASNVSEGSATAQATASAADTFQSSLSSQELAVSGVSIDEEAIQMMEYQRSYQASSQYLAVLNQILATLVQL